MNSVTMDMPIVGECLAGECAYNTNHCCHARAITVGDGIHPGCDTFLAAAPPVREMVRHAGVGACKMSTCQHNDDYECMAERIAVGHTDHGASCLSYLQRLLPNHPANPEHLQS